MKQYLSKTIFIATFGGFLFLPTGCNFLPESITNLTNNQIVKKDLSPEEIQELAKNITVKIFNSDNQGSGVIISKDEETYTVVTNAHVIRNKETYLIQTPDGEVYEAAIIRKGNSLEGNDLAVLEFTAKENYQVISLATKAHLEQDSPVYAAGFPEETGNLAINPGKITLKSPKAFIGGYQIGYTSETKSGMSGGPLLNQKGELIGINGLLSYPILNTAYNYQDGTKPDREKIEVFRASSFAVPIKTLVLVAPNLAIIPSEWKTGVTIAKKVDNIARQITVRIDSENNGNGSGVIIAKKGQTYYVVTNRHVVKNKDQYQVVTPDGKIHNLKPEDILTSVNSDAAIIKFKSYKNYQIANIARYSIPYERKQWVFISGFPAALNGTRKFTSGFRFNRDKGLTVTNDNSVLQLSNTGYELIYTNLSQPGMSGGPVLDAKGRVIGINAGVEGEQLTQKDTIQIGYSFGVPGSNFLSLTAKKGITNNLLNVSTTPAKELTETEIVTLKTHDSFAVEKPPNDTNAADWLNYGNQLWRLEKFDEAIIALEKAIELNPSLHQAHYALGLVYISQKKDEKALKQFDRTIELRAVYYQAWREKSRILNRLKKNEEALIAIDKAILWEESDFHLYYLRGLILYSLKRFNEGIQAYNKSIAIKPNNSNAYNNRGLLYYNKGEIDLGLVDYHKAIELDPNNANPYSNIGLIHYDRKEWNLAFKNFNKSISLNPNLSNAYNNRGIIYKEQKKFDLAFADYNRAIQLDPNNSNAYNNRGNIHSDRKQFDLAFADYNRAIELDPNNSSAYNNRGNLYEEQKKYDLAFADYNRAIQLDPNYSYPYNNRGLLYKEQKKYDLALADYNKAIQLDLNYADAYNNRGNIYYDRQKYDLAFADFDRAIQLDPNNSNAYNNRGLIYNEQKKYDLALADYNKAIQLDPNLLLAYNNRGVLYKEQKKYDLALADFNKAIQLDPNSVNAYNNRGVLYEEQKKYDLALADYNQAIKIDPNLVFAYNNRGNIYKQQKKSDLALADFNKAIQLNPNYVTAYYNRGKLYAQIERIDLTIADFNKAIELEPDNPEHYSFRSLMRWETRDFKSAMEDISKAIELDPKNAEYYSTRARNYSRLGNIKNIQKSIADYDRAIEISPQAHYYLSRGMNYQNLLEDQKAKADYDRAIELQPKYATAYFWRGLLRSRLNDEKGAMADYDRAIYLIEKDPEIWEYLIDSVEDSPKARQKFIKENSLLSSSRTNAYRNRADLYCKLKKYDRAILDYNKVISENPDRSQLYLARGDCYTKSRQTEKAKADYDRAIKILSKKIEIESENFDLYRLYRDRAKVREKVQDYRGAIADYNKAISLRSDDALDYVIRGSLRQKLTPPDYQGAIADFTKAIEIDPNNFNYYQGRGLARYQLKEYQGAFEDISKTIELFPKALSSQKPGLYNLRCLIGSQLTKRDYKLIIKDCSEIITIQPNNVQAIGLRGTAYIVEKEYQKATADFQTVIKLQPNIAFGYFGRGIVHYARGNYTKALAELNLALSKDRNFWPAISSLGLVKYETGEIFEAIKLWQKEIEINKKYTPSTQLALAVALYKKGETKNVYSMAEAALKLDPRIASIDYLQNKNLWGDNLIADTKRFFSTPKMQKLLQLASKE